ncbi:hypothetical protein CRG98_002307 [Punica granatum]|uniref:Uncharacterized protein n=1 Tax=Punica granatum TaxID=22663 RepID=A0A2I0L9J8_PUNGR|nr:hypothetical protein CRG98_002307 [Punica granatum]
MTIALKPKNKLLVVEGTIPKPEEGNPNRERWEMCNSMEGLPVAKYYGNCKTIWDERDNYMQVPQCHCAAATTYAAQRERKKTHQFLMGLGPKYSTESQNQVARSHESGPVVAFLGKMAGCGSMQEGQTYSGNQTYS